MRVEFIERTYGCLKPCLHGSDAHAHAKVAKPDLQKYCWVKGDLTFETLRQVVLEPAERVWLGSTPPDGAAPSYVLRTLVATGTPCLVNADIPLNSGLIAIVVARGSGKTALVDINAAAPG